MKIRVLTMGRRKKTFSLGMVFWGSLIFVLAAGLAPAPHLQAATDWTAAAALLGVRIRHTATLLGDGRLLVAGGHPSNVSGPTAEIYDPRTNTWSATANNMKAERFAHTATMLLDGRVLVAGGETQGSAELFDPAANTWTAAANMKAARSFHTATLLPDGRVLVVGGRNYNYDPLAGTEIYDPTANTWTAGNNLHTARTQHTATLLPDGRVLVAGGFNGDALASAELYDPGTGIWSPAASMQTARGTHTATCVDSLALTKTHKTLVLVVGGFNVSALASTELYDPDTNQWVYSNPLNSGRVGHTATLLPDKLLLVVGGSDGNFPPSYPANAEIFDIGTWSGWASLQGTAQENHTATLLPDGIVLVAGGNQALGPPSNGALRFNRRLSFTTVNRSQTFTRFGHAATLLSDGRVLASGGIEPGGIMGVLTDKVALFDPLANTWSSGPPLKTKLSAHTATLLADGRVLVAGGDTLAGEKLAEVEIYNPLSNDWSSAANMLTARDQHTATLLADGRVLVVGGAVSVGVLAGAEIYDSYNNIWTAEAYPHKPRLAHTATLLPDGRVLIAGGYDDQGELALVEIYDPLKRTWSYAAPMNQARGNHTATLLADGRVLVVGGDTAANTQLGSVEIYDPAANTWKNAAPLNTARELHTATLLPDGRVMVAGGVGSIPGYNYMTLSSVEIYDPVANSWTIASMNYPRFGHTATLLLNGGVLIAGGDGGSNFIQTPEITWSRPTDILRPTLSGSPATLSLDQPLTLKGSDFRDPQWQEASDGRTNQAATNYPLVQLRRLDNEQIAWLSLGSPFSAAAFTSRPVDNILPGPALVTVFVNAVPSDSKYLIIKGAPLDVIVQLWTNHTAIVGTLIHFTATVTSSLGTPTGAVQFQLDGANYGSPVTLVAGKAILSIASLSLGAHTLGAVYQGDSIFEAGAVAAPMIQEIVPARLLFPLIQR
jgi:N-acetylneuraminic acid mutarotase